MSCPASLFGSLWPLFGLCPQPVSSACVLRAFLGLSGPYLGCVLSLFPAGLSGSLWPLFGLCPHPVSSACVLPSMSAALRGAFFEDAAARRKHKNMRFTSVLDPKGCQNARKPYILRGFVNTRLSRRRHSAQISVVICGLVLHWAPARTRKTRPKTGLKVVVTLVCLWGPRSSPRGCPERAKSPQRTTKHDV